MRTGQEPRIFATYAELVKYTRNNRVFPKSLAKEDGFIKIFLKPIFRGRMMVG